MTLLTTEFLIIYALIGINILLGLELRKSKKKRKAANQELARSRTTVGKLNDQVVFWKTEYNRKIKQ